LRVSAAKALDDVAWDPTLAEHLEAIEFLRPSPLANAAKGVKAFAQTVSFREVKTMKDAAETVMAAVRAKLTYEKKVTGAYTPVSESLALGRGVCQDFAHLFIAVARLCGLAARYVSGYVNQPGELATHAWVQVWGGPDVGWANLDPTHNCWCAADYVVTAVGRDFGDVPPNRGVWKGDADETITVSVNVQPVDRVPNDLSEPIDAPAWSSAAFAAATAGREKWLSQQNRARVFRQQQSQQQQ
jgi:transglutaminase-like putative cysteine protease